MTDPRPDGPYSDSIRSDSASGLGGLWTQLAAIAAGIGALPQLLTAVQQIRDDLRRLMGPADSEDWPGLTPYLSRFIGRTDTEFPVSGVSLSSLVGGIATNAQRTVTALVQGPIAGPNTPYLLTATQQLASVDSRLNAANGLLNEQSSVLGFIGDAPAGKSIKALLAEDVEANVRSADCCEAGGGEEPPPEEQENEPPVNFGCPNGVRVTSFVERGTTVVGGETRYLWSASFPATLPGITRYTDAPTGASSYRLSTFETKRDLCIAWNFNQNTNQPDAFGRNRSSDEAVAATDTATNGPVGGGSNFILGGLVDELRWCEEPDADNDACGYIFRTTVNTPPPLNVWLSTIERSCAV